MPIFSPDTGSYQTAQSVFIVCNDPIALIYYTTNGVDPTTNTAWAVVNHAGRFAVASF